jgi:hypothetical protein
MTQAPPPPTLEDLLRNSFVEHGNIMALSRVHDHGFIYSILIFADTSNAGVIGGEEVSQLLLSLGLGLSENDVEALFELAERNDDGPISKEDFVPLAAKLLINFFGAKRWDGLEESPEVILEDVVTGSLFTYNRASGHSAWVSNE